MILRGGRHVVFDKERHLELNLSKSVDDRPSDRSANIKIRDVTGFLVLNGVDQAFSCVSKYGVWPGKKTSIYKIDGPKSDAIGADHD